MAKQAVINPGQQEGCAACMEGVIDRKVGEIFQCLRHQDRAEDQRRTAIMLACAPCNSPCALRGVSVDVIVLMAGHRDAANGRDKDDRIGHPRGVRGGQREAGRLHLHHQPKEAGAHRVRTA